MAQPEPADKSQWHLPTLDTSNRAWYTVQASAPVTCYRWRPTAPPTSAEAFATSRPAGWLDVTACREDMKII